MAPTTYFLATRMWWALAPFIAPIAGGIAGSPVVALGVAAIMAMPSFFVLDTDRSWWSDEVRALPTNPEASRSHMRTLNLWAGTALVAGIAIAILGPWS